MSKEIRLNAFDMNCVVHQSAGLWRHPRDRSDQYARLDYWIEVAHILERGKFDALFIADVLGVYDVYGGNVDAALKTSSPGTAQRSCPADPRDGARDAASGLRRDLHAVVRAALPVRAAYVHARSPHRWPRRMEYRHWLFE